MLHIAISPNPDYSISLRQLKNAVRCVFGTLNAVGIVVNAEDFDQSEQLQLQLAGHNLKDSLSRPVVFLLIPSTERLDFVPYKNLQFRLYPHILVLTMDRS